MRKRKRSKGERDIENWGEWNTCSVRAEGKTTRERRQAIRKQETWERVAGERD